MVYMFIEEPVLPENVDVMAKIARMTTIPIATGERKFTTFEYREVLEKQAATVLQPDVCHAGGISQVMKIAAMGENYYCSLAPHNPLGPLALARAYRLIPLYQTLLHRNIQLWKRAGISEQFILRNL
ncbi:MAG: enolase C-terminal domain-like protein [Blautia faecis]